MFTETNGAPEWSEPTRAIRHREAAQNSAVQGETMDSVGIGSDQLLEDSLLCMLTIEARGREGRSVFQDQLEAE